MSEARRQQADDRELRFEGVHCNLSLERVSRGIVSLKISGRDVGEFGDAPLLTLDRWLAGSGPVELFIDAREVKGASIDVSGEWARWLGARKEKLRSITMLTGSPFIHITAEFVRRFADLEGVMRICSEATVFEEALREALKWDRKL